MKKKYLMCTLLMVCMGLITGLSGCEAESSDKEKSTAETVQHTQNEENAEPSKYIRVAVHDPSITQTVDGTFYIFGSHLAAAKSEDLRAWNNIGSAQRLFGVAKLDVLMLDIKSWMKVNNEDLGCWAADVIYNKTTGKYYFYACSSQFGTTDSVIWFATSDNIEGPYGKATPIIYSGFTNTTSGIWSYNNTNLKELLANGTIKEMGDWFHSDGSYDSNPGKMPNAIDPALFYDEDGRMWMCYGSYFGGIYLLEIDLNTGIPIYPERDDPANDVVAYFGKKIASSEGSDGNGEGPFILYDENSGNYYLFITYGNLDGCGGYNTRVFKAAAPDGPYVDLAGNQATKHVNKGLKLMGNYMISGTSAYISPGHSSAIVDSKTGKMFHVYHTRFADGYGNLHQVRVHQMVVNEYGFPVVLPYEYDGETVNEKGYSTEEIVGEYTFINHGNTTTYSSDIKDVYVNTESVISLNEDGTITGGLKGKWFMEEGSPNVTIVIMNVPYKGVFCYQSDETAERNRRFVFAAAGTNNSTIWGIKK